MLLSGGNTRVWPTWKVEEASPAGYCRVYWVHGGHVTYRDEHEQRRLAAGGIYIFPSAAPYRMATEAAAPLRCTFLHVDIHPAAVRRLVCLGAGGTEGAVFEAIRRAYDDRPAAAAALADAFVACCLESGALAPPSPFLAEVHAYMAAHFREPLPLRELSARFGYNEQYFIRRFKAAAGVPPHRYLLHMRLQEALRLLRGKDGLEAIAEAAGFADSKSLCRAFSRRYGASPGQFRRLTAPLP